MSNLIENTKLKFDYETLETLEAGIELFGYEVKSLRSKHGSLAGAHITVRGGEAFIIGSFIPPYQEKNTPAEYDPYRNRRILLSKKEIGELASHEFARGLTLVPISMYNKGRVIKVKIALVRGKKKLDKRQTIMKREDTREIEREYKNRRE